MMWIAQTTRFWNVVSFCGLVLLIVGIASRGRYPGYLVVPRGPLVPATTALSLFGTAAMTAGLVGRVAARAGLALSGATLMIGAMAWVLLGRHPLAGPVVVNLSNEHGIHLLDPVAAVPLVLGMSLVHRSIRHGSDDRSVTGTRHHPEGEATDCSPI